MKIGIDIDDTICNTWEFVKPYYEKNFNLDKNITENNSYFKALNCSLEEYYDFCKKNISKLTFNVPVKKDAVMYINKLKEEGHEINFITARSTFDMEEPYDQTKKYLEQNNIKYDNLYVNSLKKEEVTLKNNIDIFIDDSVKHCTNVSKTGIDVLMMTTTYNKKYTNFKRVNNWKEIYDFINKKEKYHG